MSVGGSAAREIMVGWGGVGCVGSVELGRRSLVVVVVRVAGRVVDVVAWAACQCGGCQSV